MSDNIFDADDVFDQVVDGTDVVAEDAASVTEEPQKESFGSAADDDSSAGDTAVGDAPAGEKSSLLKSFNIFDGLLLASLICVSLATLFLFLELSKFGSLLDGFPWRTSEFLKQ